MGVAAWTGANVPASGYKKHSLLFRANLFSVSVVQDASQTFILHNRNSYERGTVALRENRNGSQVL